MKNSEATGKYIIVKDLNFSDYMKDEDNKISIYNSFEDAADVCGIYELEDVLILKVMYNHVEKN